jgi:3-isopropylmalate dehydrogenase
VSERPSDRAQLRPFRIATIPGDGVGPEVVAAARRVVDAAAERFGFDVEWSEHPAGGNAIDAYGVAIRDEDVEACGAADAILLGACGGPKWDNPKATVRPEQALFTQRGALGLFANLRPVTVHPTIGASAAPVRPELLQGVDMLIVRELTGGLYFGARTEATGEVGERHASDTLPYSEAEISRVVRLAFELARGRRGRLTSVDKANVLATSRLWRTVVEEIRLEYPDVEVGHQLVDSCAMLLVRQPAWFDVLVTENMFGDILSDEAAVLAGSLGMLPSASLGDRRTEHGRFGLYEPIHGSAPTLAGRDLANPLGTILSAAMMLRWSLGLEAAAASVEAAVSIALDAGYRTADLVPPGGSTEGLRQVGTRGMADAVVAALGAPATQAVAGGAR